jgi:hypothetical protein
VDAPPVEALPVEAPPVEMPALGTAAPETPVPEAVPPEIVPGPVDTARIIVPPAPGQGLLASLGLSAAPPPTLLEVLRAPPLSDAVLAPPGWAMAPDAPAVPPAVLLAAIPALRPLRPEPAAPPAPEPVAAPPAPEPVAAPLEPELIAAAPAPEPVAAPPAPEPVAAPPAPEPVAAPLEPELIAAAPAPAPVAARRAPRFTPAEGKAAFASLGATPVLEAEPGAAAEWTTLARAIAGAAGEWHALALGGGAADTLAAAARAAKTRGLTVRMNVVEPDPASFAKLRATIDASGLTGAEARLLQAEVSADPVAPPLRAARVAALLTDPPQIDLLRVALPGMAQPLLTHAEPLLTEKVRWLLLVTANRQDEALAVRRLASRGWQMLADQPSVLALGNPRRGITPGLQVWRGPLP